MTAISRLELKSVGVRYRDADAVSDISLSVPAGRWLTVIGPNGAGKSSMLKAIAGAVDHSGVIELLDRDDQPASGSRAHHVAYVPQSPVLPDGMSTAEYVLMGRTAHLRWFQFESQRDRKLVAKTLRDLGLDHHAERPVVELSGGEAQRVALARAIVQQASVLVLDEPTSALDLAHQVAVLELIEQLRRRFELIVVCSMHDLTMASRFADDVLLLDGGTPALYGSPTSILTSENLSRHYGVDVTVLPTDQNGLVVVPGHSTTTHLDHGDSHDERSRSAAGR